jgi:hypothetical protein
MLPNGDVGDPVEYGPLPYEELFNGSFIILMVGLLIL